MKKNAELKKGPQQKLRTQRAYGSSHGLVDGKTGYQNGKKKTKCPKGGPLPCSTSCDPVAAGGPPSLFPPSRLSATLLLSSANWSSQDSNRGTQRERRPISQLSQAALWTESASQTRKDRDRSGGRQTGWVVDRQRQDRISRTGRSVGRSSDRGGVPDRTR